jgi:dihydrolipoamide dehydrogenase
VATRFVIIGGGPAGNTAATYAARLGAEVTVVERDVVGGAAHLWDCIPSKTMIATGGAISFSRRIHGMGLEQQTAEVDIEALTDRIEEIKNRLQHGITRLLESQGCSCCMARLECWATTMSRLLRQRERAASPLTRC